VHAIAEELERAAAFPAYPSAPYRAAAGLLRRLQAENERLLAEQAQAMSEASSLAMSLFQKHYSSDPDYASGAVLFGLCDELRGVISQIDNMSTGLARAELEARKPLPPDALADKCEAWLQAGGTSNIVDAFEAGYRAAERAEEGKRK
jgi:hypothetical protein